MMDDKQLALDMRYLRMARIWAENSYCERRKVGALIVKDKRIIADGYNGTPVGFENICEDEARQQHQRQLWGDGLRHRRPLHRVRQAHHPEPHAPRRLQHRVPST